MDVKIGIQHTNRELSLDLAGSAEELGTKVSEAVAAGSVLTLTDTKGRTVLVPAAQLAYVEVGSGTTGAVGFRS